MSAPLCPVHGVPMKPSSKKPGGYYCVQKNADGSYCKNESVPEPTAAPETRAIATNGGDGPYLLAAECVKAAFTAYGPLPPRPEEHDAVAGLAVKIFRAMKAVIS